jgi:ribosomal protein S18 acetylase RimI-like enzyme
MAPIIRSASTADCAQLADLMCQLGYPTTSAEMGSRLAAILDNRDFQTLVAEEDGRILAMIGLHTAQPYERNAPYGLISALIVAEDARGRGIGSALVSAGEAWFQARGVESVVVTSRSTRTQAHGFYQRLGYELTGLRFVKLLDQPLQVVDRDAFEGADH